MLTLRTRLRTSRASAARPGQATVEFALVCLFGLLPMILGTIELGRGVWYYHQLSQLSREGARYLIVTTANGTYHQLGNQPGSYTLATCACPDSAVNWIGTRAVGLAEDQVTVVITGPTESSPPPYGVHRGDDVTVRLSYPYRPVVTTILNIPATINLTAGTQMQLEQ